MIVLFLLWCGYQVPFPWIVPPHYTRVQGHQRSLTPFRVDPRHRPTSVCPPLHNHTRENLPGAPPHTAELMLGVGVGFDDIGFSLFCRLFFCDRRITSAADTKPTTMVAVEAFHAIARNNTFFLCLKKYTSVYNRGFRSRLQRVCPLVFGTASQEGPIPQGAWLTPSHAGDLALFGHEHACGPRALEELFAGGVAARWGPKVPVYSGGVCGG